MSHALPAGDAALVTRHPSAASCTGLLARARVNRLDYALSLISGALLALSFPKFGHPAFAWIALVPLLLAFTGWNGRAGPLRGIAPLRAFILSLLAGMAFFLGTVYWTGTELLRNGGARWAAAFPRTTVRYLRLAPAAGLPDPWTITEIECLE